MATPVRAAVPTAVSLQAAKQACLGRLHAGHASARQGRASARSYHVVGFSQLDDVLLCMKGCPRTTVSGCRCQMSAQGRGGMGTNASPELSSSFSSVRSWPKTVNDAIINATAPKTKQRERPYPLRRGSSLGPGLVVAMRPSQARKPIPDACQLTKAVSKSVSCCCPVRQCFLNASYGDMGRQGDLRGVALQRTEGAAIFKS